MQVERLAKYLCSIHQEAMIPMIIQLSFSDLA